MKMSWLKGKQWIPYRRDMLESPAYRNLSALARDALHAVEIEHLRCAGKENGNLIVPYNVIRKYCKGASKRRIAQALREMEVLGFLEIKRGRMSGGKPVPSQYRLTHLPGHNGGSPSDEWEEIKTDEEANQRLSKITQKQPKTARFKAYLASPDDGFSGSYG